MPYTVEVEAPRPLEKLLENNLDLVRWRGNPRLDLDQLQRLVKAAPEQARTLIATEGYYSPKVTAGLDTSGGEPVARVMVEPGPPVLVGDIELVLNGFAPTAPDATPFDAAALRRRWTMPVGSVFRQADWEQAKRNLLRQVMQARYPRARLVASSATVDPDVLRALLRVEIDSGPEVKFGGLRVEGLQRYPSSIITNLNQIKPGEEYSEAALQAFQARIQDTGYFSGVDVSVDMSGLLGEDIDAAAAADPGADPDDKPGANPDGAPGAATPPAPKPAPPQDAGPLVLPVLVRVTENKRKHADIGLGLSSNTGARAQVSYDDLNVFGLRMKSNVLIETKHQEARADFYWPTTAKGYNDSIGTGFERTDLSGQLTSVFSVAARRAWGGPLLERSLTLELLTEQREAAGLLTSRSRSMPLTYNITRRALDNLLLPTKGYVLNAQLGGALLPILTDERFLRASARGIYYRPAGASGGLIFRAEAGALASRQKAGVPETFLFRAGGDQSVRGYGYQELGVRAGDAVVGGRYLLTGSAEYNYWFKPPWGVAVFVDAGNAADKLRELKPELGYGIGARWRSPVGPINVDAAYGQASKKFRLHFSLGFTF
ncbi:MAG: autotransporter assembly complex family protein [Pseudomonadota bacterium]